MKIRLAQFLKNNNQIVIDTNSLNFELTLNLNRDDKIYQIPRAGFYSYLQDELVMLFCFNRKIYIYFNNKFHSFDEAHIKVNYTQNNQKALLKFDTISFNHQISYSIEDMIPVSTLTYTEDEEDANFGLWIYNVLNNNERLEIMKNTCITIS